MNTPKIEVHQYDGVKSSLHTGKLLPGERGYAGGESATPRTDDAQILASFNEVEPPHYPRAFLAVTADFARRLERETATLHAQLGEARAELERVQTANNGDSSFPHFDSVVIPTEADADIKALGALLTPEGLGLYNRIARRNYDARRKLQLELNEAREALGHWMQRAEWAEKRESAQIARMKMREGELVGALKTIASYDEHSKHGEGICPYGCDTPHIARAALQSLRALTEQPGKP